MQPTIDQITDNIKSKDKGQLDKRVRLNTTWSEWQIAVTTDITWAKSFQAQDRTSNKDNNIKSKRKSKYYFQAEKISRETD